MKTELTNEVTLTRAFALCWQKKWMILILTLIFGLGAILYSITQDTLYKGEVLIYTGTEDTVESFLKLNALLHSRSFQEKLSQEKNFDTTELSFDKNSRLLTLTLHRPDAMAAANNANYIAKKLLEELLSQKAAMHKQSIKILEDKISDNMEKLKQLIKTRIHVNSNIKTSETELKVELINQDILFQQDLISMLIEKKEGLLIEIEYPSSISILDESIVPQNPDKPNRKLIIVIGFIFGLWLGIVLAIARGLQE